MKYKNPIIPGFNPDPSICRVGEDFYLVTSTFEFFPGVPIYHSKNLVNWELINYCLTEDSQLPLHGAVVSKGIYAPTLRYHNGTFFMTTTNVSCGGNFIVHTNDIYGKWSEPAYVKQGGIDPSLFWDDDGVCYFVSNGSDNPEDKQAIYLCEINPFTGEMLTASRCISPGCGGRYPEAPHIYKENGYYYLMLAEGGTEYGHMETMQRAKIIYGPYEKCPHNPILSHRDTPSPIQATGHADIIEDQNGNWWLVCLAIRPIGDMLLHHIGRESFLAPVKWKNGWPVVGNDGTIDFEMEGPLPGPAPTPVSIDFEDSFDKDKLDLRWSFVRNPIRECYRLEGGKLDLISGKDDLSTNCGNPTMIAARQQAFSIEAVAQIEGEVQNGQRSGLTAFYNSDYHYDILITKDNGGHKICLRKRVADIDVIVASHKIDYNNSIRFKIVSSPEWYTFFYENGGRFIELGRGKTSLLATEVTHPMTFTGTFIGVFTEQGNISVTCVSVKEIK